MKKFTKSYASVIRLKCSNTSKQTGTNDIHGNINPKQSTHCQVPETGWFHGKYMEMGTENKTEIITLIVSVELALFFQVTPIWARSLNTEPMPDNWSIFIEQMHFLSPDQSQKSTDRKELLFTEYYH